MIIDSMFQSVKIYVGLCTEVFNASLKLDIKMGTKLIPGNMFIILLDTFVLSWQNFFGLQIVIGFSILKLEQAFNDAFCP